MWTNVDKNSIGGTDMDNYLKDYPPVLSVNDVAKILGVAPGTVRSLVKTGAISGIKVGRLIKIPKDRLINYLETNNC